MGEEDFRGRRKEGFLKQLESLLTRDGRLDPEATLDGFFMPLDEACAILSRSREEKHCVLRSQWLAVCGPLEVCEPLMALL